MDLQSPAILTLEQIRQRHDGEWVLIAYTELDRKNLADRRRSCQCAL